MPKLYNLLFLFMISSVISLVLAGAAQSQSAAGCAIPPSLTMPMKQVMFVVGTYHTTGIAGSDRVMPLRYFPQRRFPNSVLAVGRTDGAYDKFWNDIYEGTYTKRTPDGQIEEFHVPKFSVTIGRAHDGYPLYSKLGFHGDYRGADRWDRLDSGLGFTYHNSEGYELFPEQDIGDWRRYAYPESVNWGQETFFRGEAKIGGVEAILKCDPWPNGPVKYSDCKIFKKREPIFYSSRFSGEVINQTQAIEHIMDQIVECMMGEF